jgi:hypothetical protein
MTEEDISKELQKFVSESIIGDFEPPSKRNDGKWKILTPKENPNEFESELIPHEEIEGYLKGLEEKTNNKNKEEAKKTAGDNMKEQKIKQINL